MPSWDKPLLDFVGEFLQHWGILLDFIDHLLRHVNHGWVVDAIQSAVKFSNKVKLRLILVGIC